MAHWDLSSWLELLGFLQSFEVSKFPAGQQLCRSKLGFFHSDREFQINSPSSFMLMSMCLQAAEYEVLLLCVHISFRILITVPQILNFTFSRCFLTSSTAKKNKQLSLNRHDRSPWALFYLPRSPVILTLPNLAFRLFPPNHPRQNRCSDDLFTGKRSCFALSYDENIFNFCFLTFHECSLRRMHNRWNTRLSQYH